MEGSDGCLRDRSSRLILPLLRKPHQTASLRRALFWGVRPLTLPEGNRMSTKQRTTEATEKAAREARNAAAAAKKKKAKK
jgi:hypothetical protein